MEIVLEKTKPQYTKKYNTDKIDNDKNNIKYQLDNSQSVSAMWSTTVVPLQLGLKVFSI